MPSPRRTRRADQDIIDIYVQGTDAFGRKQAESYGAALRRTLSLLAASPRLASDRPEFHPAIRVHRFRSHLILYRLDDQGVLILRILHGRADWQRLL